MTQDLLRALISFAFVTSVTPGPNNMMLLASGVNFGLRRSLPHMIGISLGHALMVVLVGMGLAGLFHSFPPLLIGLKIASVIYMLWLAWKVANSGAPGHGTANPAPFTFLQAAAFQWVNPKAWAMALTAISAYSGDGSVQSILIVAMVFACVNLPSVAVWVVAGEKLRGWLAEPARLKAFNWTMAALLVLSLLPVIWY
jgi:threonine/homoserine/homoserine lactone efflux protein